MPPRVVFRGLAWTALLSAGWAAFASLSQRLDALAPASAGEAPVGASEVGPTCEPPVLALVAEPGPDTTLASDPRRWMVVPQGDRWAVVLEPRIEDAWLQPGPPRRMSRPDGPATVVRTLDPGALPASVGAAEGTRVRLLGRGSVVCEGTIGPVEAVAELWDDMEDGLEEAAIWEQGRRLLIAAVEGTGACEGSLVAVPESVEASVWPVVPGVERPSGVIRRAAVRARGMEQVRDELAELDPGTTPALSTALAWDVHVEPAGGSALALFHTEGDAFESCGGISGAWGGVQVAADGDPAGSWLAGRDERPVAVFDLDADRRPEVLVEGILAGPTRLVALGPDGGGQRMAIPGIPFLGCPC